MEALNIQAQARLVGISLAYNICLARLVGISLVIVSVHDGVHNIFSAETARMEGLNTC